MWSASQAKSHFSDSLSDGKDMFDEYLSSFSYLLDAIGIAFVVYIKSSIRSAFFTAHANRRR